MTEYVDYLVNISAVLWAYLSSVIDAPAVYIAYIFALLAVLAAIIVSFWFAITFAKWVWSFFKGALH